MYCGRACSDAEDDLGQWSAVLATADRKYHYIWLHSTTQSLRKGEGRSSARASTVVWEDECSRTRLRDFCEETLQSGIIHITCQ